MSHAETLEQRGEDEFPRPFGQYLLLENFARGGMGEVYLAKIGGIAGLERYCVLKKLRSELTRDREYVTRFIDEARVVVTLNHANICHVFDVGRVGEEYYLAMEYISGRDVRTTQDRCRTRERTIPPATALHLVCETLEALDYAHRRNHPLTGEPLNLVHRDVSPQNVLVSFEGEVKLIDFGLAASRLKVERTQPNVVMGKMAYMAPEQARGDPIDSRADLFACGVLGYELLAGERFYEGMTANDIWQVAGKGGFAPPKWRTLDEEIQKILSKALHPDPKKRFATCGDFREALASHLHWRFPGTGVRGLREVMNELFADEVRKERELLAKFGKVTFAGFRTEFEESKSQSVSLARADETGPTASRTLLVRNEQSGSGAQAGGPMPPPSAQALPQRGDVHREATRLTVDPARQDTQLVDRPLIGQTPSVTPATPAIPSPGRRNSGPNQQPANLQAQPTQIVSRGDTERQTKKSSTDENEPADTATQKAALPSSPAADGAFPERTMRVRVKRNLDDDTQMSQALPPAPGGRLKLIAAVGVVAAVAAVAIVVVSEGEDPKATAVATPSTPSTLGTVRPDPLGAPSTAPPPPTTPAADASASAASEVAPPPSAPAPAEAPPPASTPKAASEPAQTEERKASNGTTKRATSSAKLAKEREARAEREREKQAAAEQKERERQAAAEQRDRERAAAAAEAKAKADAAKKSNVTRKMRADYAVQKCGQCTFKVGLQGGGVAEDKVDELEACLQQTCNIKPLR